MGVLPGDEIDGYAALGELGLGGALAPVAGVLPAAIAASATSRMCSARRSPSALLRWPPLGATIC